MKPNYTHLILVLDASTSMGHLQSATIEGVNSLVAEQKALPGDFTTALYQFASSVNEVTAFHTLTKHNYIPGGMTALFDAVGTAILNEGQKLAAMKESERPDKVVVVIVTDGEENSSKEYKIAQIKDMVKEQQDTYKWQFVFLGANIDAFASGSAFGFSPGSTMQYNATVQGVSDSYSLTSNALRAFRGGSSASVDLSAVKKDQDAQ